MRFKTFNLPRLARNSCKTIGKENQELIKRYITMSDFQKEKVEEQEAPQIIKIRITLTSTKVKQLENVSNNIVLNAEQHNLVKKGPVRLPTKVLKISTRKTPNGEGSKTWETYEMRIHKRYIDLEAPVNIVKRITQITIEPGVDVEVVVASN
ncbi:40S ribosomal uS10 domain-containing protein NDAI_0B01650 [Naumovozyma dairenensis CBS 421]|uniref:Small ribosomal subunit protein uS10 n=1 Tax=Naumovozyma dairenensis (strain ATCC 10597 / BCRC 20456 / CBS 421 / NBRC 0211 / NRRL Y-12639) TaxID=1071378 RepID=G0W5Y8_NAUDC|nr:ribosomal protein S20 NDAI_0B01650 [Naumovozyma dairenensis CBS 421]CCD23199.1 hypothetical protein NDAI_0B01650 [Naumovozyma dairenensis CBS 421]